MTRTNCDSPKSQWRCHHKMIQSGVMNRYAAQTVYVQSRSRRGGRRIAADFTTTGAA